MPPPADFLEQNIEAVKGEARQKRPEDLLDFGEVYNYAGQNLQYFDMQVTCIPVTCMNAMFNA